MSEREKNFQVSPALVRLCEPAESCVHGIPYYWQCVLCDYGSLAVRNNRPCETRSDLAPTFPCSLRHQKRERLALEGVLYCVISLSWIFVRIVEALAHFWRH
mmetsp:Transcript_35790/g.70271  ORF Transcript_35790/g.70271 Transcript_35790/m.70271 type:complete len:102 (+) Transcript_35790:1622-1927(+)